MILRRSTQPIEIMYVDSRPRTDNDTMMLKAKVLPSWMRHRIPQMTDVV